MDEDTYQVIRNYGRNSYSKLLYKLMMKKSSNGILKKEITSSDIDFSDNNIQGSFRWSGFNSSSAPPKHFVGATIVNEKESHFEGKELGKKTSFLEEFTLESSKDRPCKRRKRG
ncbi:uncharacterized protein LOC123674879 [Harmonia axyridis]|uniref:uncharacterized protein LOC123674879 n=1 Tax=Harmonia axyridis TaxID=115357 RepID=UPI001E275E51|nr:uncharacterized protein LOC123674879 [Harmonia axyridis]